MDATENAGVLCPGCHAMSYFLIKLRESIRRSEILKFSLKGISKALPVVLRERMLRMTVTPYNDVENEYHVIFIHIPKTAGKALFASLFGREFASHQNIRNYRKYDKKRFDDYFKFAVVRNPWDRFASAFFYLKSSKVRMYQTKEDLEFRERYLKPFNNIAEFIYALDENGSLKKKVLNWTHFIPQYKYVSDEAGSNLLNYIGKYEELEQAFNYIKEKVGSDAPTLIEKNRNRKGEDYLTHYNLETAKIVEGMYKKDIEMFGYGFPYDKLKE